MLWTITTQTLSISDPNLYLYLAVHDPGVLGRMEKFNLTSQLKVNSITEHLIFTFNNEHGYFHRFIPSIAAGTELSQREVL